LERELGSFEVIGCGGRSIGQLLAARSFFVPIVTAMKNAPLFF
jgi:hypothetical protein